MASRVCCLVAYLTWWALLVLVFAVGGVSDVTGWVRDGSVSDVAMLHCSSGS